MPEKKRFGGGWFAQSDDTYDPEEQKRIAEAAIAKRKAIGEERERALQAEREAAYMPPGVDLGALWREDEESSGVQFILIIVVLVLQVIGIVAGLIWR